jgi:aspartyl protease family protein
MKYFRPTLFLLLLSYLFTPGVYAASVKVIGLFTDKALLQIDSQQKLMRKGETFSGVTLISASGRGAVISIDGETRKLGLNQGIQGNYKKPDNAISKIYPDFQGMYYIAGKINARPIRFLVDTGATYVTMSGAQAMAIGIDYRKGTKSFAHTAAATVPVWQIKLNSVSIGGIKVPNVDATVIEGSQPLVVLLGNSFLKYTRLQRIGNVMELEKKF